MKNIKNIKLNFFLFSAIVEHVLKLILLSLVDTGESAIGSLLWEEAGESTFPSGRHIPYQKLLLIMGIELASQRCEANALSTAFLEYIDNETFKFITCNMYFF